MFLEVAEPLRLARTCVQGSSVVFTASEVADELLRLARTCVQGSSMAFASVRPEASGKISLMSSWMSSSIFLVLAAGSFVVGGGVVGGLRGLLRDRSAAALAAGELI